MDTSIVIDKARLDLVEKKIVEMGQWSVRKQSSLHVSYKEDSSPVTQVDLGISHEIVLLLKSLFPEAGIITEEEVCERHDNAPYTFVLDPIDGTDVFSQGLPSFCTALGILDSSFSPCGAIIFAPRFGRGTPDGLLLRLNPGEKPTINGRVLTAEGDKENIRQLAVSSSMVRRVDFSSYTGKIRIFGSQILQILAPRLFFNIAASINEPCFIWDYAAAHAILKSLGMDLYRPDMSLFTYSASFISREREKSITYGGLRETVEKLVSVCPVRDGVD